MTYPAKFSSPCPPNATAVLMILYKKPACQLQADPFIMGSKKCMMTFVPLISFLWYHFIKSAVAKIYNYTVLFKGIWLGKPVFLVPGPTTKPSSLGPIQICNMGPFFPINALSVLNN